jgi:hypothetical protein
MQKVHEVWPWFFWQQHREFAARLGEALIVAYPTPSLARSHPVARLSDHFIGLPQRLLARCRTSPAPDDVRPAPWTIGVRDWLPA